ncbi:hypothetical protein ACHAXS_000324 [Conticribra weissflogii]
MELPQGIKRKYGTSKDCILRLVANLYGQKQAGRVWNQYLVDKLASIGFKQLAVDKCVFYWNNVIFIVYVDDGIFLGPSDQVLMQVIQEIKDTGLEVEDQGYPSDYVGVNVQKQADDMGLKDKYMKPVPAKVSLHLIPSKPPLQLPFNCRQAKLPSSNYQT